MLKLTVQFSHAIEARWMVVLNLHKELSPTLKYRTRRTSQMPGSTRIGTGRSRWLLIIDAVCIVRVYGDA